MLKTKGKASNFLLFIFSFGSQTYAQNRTIPGEVIKPYPTIINLAIEWYIQGDDNQNGIVSVQFREKGKTDWKQGMPLRRVPARENEGFSWENKHSGSIFDLNPDTGYEIKLKLEDPDGGSAEKTVEAHTRPVPERDVPDLRPKPGSRVEDAAVYIPNAEKVPAVLIWIKSLSSPLAFTALVCCPELNILF